MKLRPFHWPDSRVIGATPARLAAALASRWPSSGISASRPEAVMIAEATAPRRPRSAARCPAPRAARPADSSTAASAAGGTPAAAGCAPPCGPSPARPAPCAVRRGRRVADRGATRRSGNAAPIRASTCASALSVLASWPIACAKRRARNAFTRVSGSRSTSASSNAVQGRRLVHHLVRGRADPRRQRNPAATVPPPRCSAGERPDAPSPPTSASWCIKCSCLASLDAQEGVRKDAPQGREIHRPLRRSDRRRVDLSKP